MHTRRQFVGAGMSALALGLMGRRAYASLLDVCAGTGSSPLGASDPVFRVGPTANPIMFEGVPFERGWTGDRQPHPSFVIPPNPTPTEFVDVVVVGGGLSGLSSAYLLRDLNPIVLEFNHRFGGQAQGESWQGSQYPTGSAYVITPDTGSFLDGFYSDLGMDKAHRFQSGMQDPIELGGQILHDFWTGAGQSPEDAALFQQYAKVVNSIAYGMYPDLPLPNNAPLPAFVHDMDTRSFKEDIEMRLGAPLPPLLAGAVQAYCYSSFAAGMEEISAVGGWNFLAAEEYGRWVLPGGNSYIVRELWKRLAQQSRQQNLCMLRPGCLVLDVQLSTGATGGALVTYVDDDKNMHTIHAKKVVMSCPKFVGTWLLRQLPTLDPDKLDAMHALEYNPYVVANVLLNKPLDPDMYDVFLLRDGDFPTNQLEVQTADNVIDMLNGVYAQPTNNNGVLTLYFPLPWGGARFSIVTQTAWHDYATKLAPQINYMLGVLGLTQGDINRVRLTRWGHAMPVHQPGVINSGIVEKIRRPIDDTIYFVHQDNWALPAVENCLIDADIYTQFLRDSL